MYILLLGGNNIRHSETAIEAEIKTLVKRVTLINEAVTKADDCRIILCSTVPDPQPKVDRNLMELDSALKRIQLGRGSQFLNLRTALTANHMLMTDCYKRGGKDIHLNEKGNNIVGHKIKILLESMVSAPTRAPPISAPACSPSKDFVHSANRRSNSGHKSGNSNRKQCFNCQKFDHLSRECPEMQCYRCR